MTSFCWGVSKALNMHDITSFPAVYHQWHDKESSSYDAHSLSKLTYANSCCNIFKLFNRHKDAICDVVYLGHVNGEHKWEHRR